MNYLRIARYALVVCAALAAVLALASCTPKSSGPSVQTIKWQQDGKGNVEFSTNDSQYYGYAFWDPLSTEALSSGNSLIATITKESGASNVAYGVIFDYVSGSSSPTFYDVVITTDGRYAVQQYSGGSFSFAAGMSAYQTSSALNTGVGVANTIKITYSSTTGYAIYFNTPTGAAATLSDTTSGEGGFLAAVGTKSDESFPTTAEDDLFKMTSPNVYP